MGGLVHICVLKMYLITTKKGGLCKLLLRTETADRAKCSSRKPLPFPKNSAERTGRLVLFSCLYILASEEKWCEC